MSIEPKIIARGKISLVSKEGFFDGASYKKLGLGFFGGKNVKV